MENPTNSEEKLTPSIEETKQRFFDARFISKQYDKEGRGAKAIEITRLKRELQTIRENISSRENISVQIKQEASVLYFMKSEKILALKKITASILMQFKSILKIKDKTASSLVKEIDSLTTEIESLLAQSEDIANELEILKNNQKNIPNPEKLLKTYYETMETIPLSNTEKREFLKPELLSQLSMEEYVALWRRLNPHFLSHVTRQGFRDHNAMIYHSSGLQKFHNGLVSTLEDKKMLNSSMAVRDGLRARDEVTIKKFLEQHVLSAASEEEAREKLNEKLNSTWASAPHYPDKTAVHFAAEVVANDYYGGESNNEVFFLYPSDVLASQYCFAFNGGEKDLTKPQSETKWNDVFIWPSNLDNSGISVDAGIVFLPKTTLVDPKTGSKYASEIKTIEGEQKKTLIEDEQAIAGFTEWAKKLNNDSPIVQAYKQYRKEGGEELNKVYLEVTHQEMFKLGFDEETAANLTSTIVLYDVIGSFVTNGKLDPEESTPEEAAYRKLKLASANWKKAKNGVTAKEYWEKYFLDHPEQKPKHIVFYDGDPTLAIHKFQQKYGIGEADTSNVEGQLLGFDDKHQVLDYNKNSRIWAGYEELVATSHKIIAEHYRVKNNTV